MMHLINFLLLGRTYAVGESAIVGAQKSQPVSSIASSGVAGFNCVCAAPELDC